MKKSLTILRNVLLVFVCLILCAVTILLDFVGSRQNLSHTIQIYMTGGLSFADKDIKVASYENAAVVSKEIVSEGTVLLKNDNNILPLEGVDKINMFGYRAAHPYLSGTGSSGVEGENSTTFRDAVANVGIEVNDALYQAFFDYGDGSDPGNFTIVEPNADDENFYSEQKWAEYEAYSDTAVYVIGRTSGEGADLAHGYLTISDNELEVLHNIEKLFIRN